MMYQKLVTFGLGGATALAAVALPFMGLERFAGDVRPVIMAMAVAAVAIGCGVIVWRPTAFEAYVKLASLSFFVLTLLGVLGLLSEMDAGVMRAAGGPGMPTWLGGW